MHFRITGKRAVQATGCAMFCLIVCIIAFLNRTLVLEPVTDCLHGESSFENMKETMQDNYLGERFREKNELLSLNGGFARIQGRLQYNEVVRASNGMLASAVSSQRDTTRFSDNLGRFNSFLKEEGIPFLFILAPNKGPIDGGFLPAGVTDMSNTICDRLLLQLTEWDLPFLDLRQEMSRTKEQVAKYFYRTDHHWNADGAFFAFQQIMKAVQIHFPETKMTYADLSMWKKTMIPDWWLGTHGRRVGPLFGGVEDLDFYLPAFDTEMTRYSVGVWVCKGDFRAANIREYFLHFRDYMKMDSYHRYIGGSYGLTYHRNQQAENQLKLLLIGDSFKEPVECFLSTEFTSIDVLDPRVYGQMSIMDYVKLNPPDMVVVMNSFNSLTNKNFFDYGRKTELIAVGETVLPEVTVSAASGELDYAVLPVQLENGKNYVLSLDRIQVLGGDPDGASVMLYNGEEIVDQTVFDIDYGNQFEYHWGFQIPRSVENKDQYQLRLYAGVSEGTEGISLVYQGIRVQECLLSDQK